MADVDGDLAGLGEDLSSGSLLRQTAFDGYAMEEPCDCIPVPTPPPVTFVQTTGPRIKGASALGGGIVRPFRRTEHQDFANDSGIPEVLSCVGQVLGTRKGTAPWRPDFGCDLERLRHKNKDADFVALVRGTVDDALRRWEPRAQVSAVESDPNPPAGALGLEISVSVAGQIKKFKL